MALNERIALFVAVLDNGVIEARRTRQIFDDLELIGERHQRAVYVPTMPLLTLPAGRIRQIANLIWTPQVIADYVASLPAPIPTPPE